MALFLFYDFLLVFDHVVFNTGMSFGMCAGHCVLARLGDVNFLQKRLSFSLTCKERKDQSCCYSQVLVSAFLRVVYYFLMGQPLGAYLKSWVVYQELLPWQVLTPALLLQQHKTSDIFAQCLRQQALLSTFLLGVLYVELSCQLMSHRQIVHRISNS